MNTVRQTMWPLNSHVLELTNMDHQSVNDTKLKCCWRFCPLLLVMLMLMTSERFSLTSLSGSSSPSDRSSFNSRVDLGKMFIYVHDQQLVSLRQIETLRSDTTAMCHRFHSLLLQTKMNIQTLWFTVSKRLRMKKCPGVKIWRPVQEMRNDQTN